MSAIPFGNAFSVGINDMRVAATNVKLTSAIGTAQLKTSAGVNIGSAVSLSHQGSGNYRAEFPASLFTDSATASQMAVGQYVTCVLEGTAPAFRFDLVLKVKARG